MTRDNVIKLARKLAIKRGEPVYVVHDPSQPEATGNEDAYFPAWPDDLDTWFAGTQDNDIVWCSD